MVPQCSVRIPRVRTYFGYCQLTLDFVYETITPYGCASHHIRLSAVIQFTVHNPKSISTLGLASFAFARHYSRNLGWFLFLFLLRCFSSEGSLTKAMDSLWCLTTWLVRGFPIRTSPDQSIFAAPRSFSQLITSFIGSQCQGILLVLFFAWTNSPDCVSTIRSLHEFRKSVLFANCNTITCLYGKTIILIFRS